MGCNFRWEKTPRQVPRKRARSTDVDVGSARRKRCLDEVFMESRDDKIENDGENIPSNYTRHGEKTSAQLLFRQSYMFSLELRQVSFK